MEVLTEMDEYVNAMAKINLNEAVMPYVNGRLVESGTYNKVQKILNTPELEKAHVYCYDLDLDNLEESDVEKINNLYKLGVDRGFIDDDLQYQDDVSSDPAETADVDVEEEPVKTRKCFVAMYSATKNGQIKTGEAYSTALDVDAAKADIKSQLSKFGYSNISILAIEASDEPCYSDDDCEDIEKSKSQYANVQEADELLTSFSEEDNEDDDSEDDDSEDGEDEEYSDEDSDEDEDIEDDDSEDEDTEDDEDDELDDNEKSNLKDKYKKVFKNVMVKCKFEGKSFDDLSIAEKVKFFTELSKVWTDNHEPSDFMSDKEVDQLNKIVINK